MLIAFIAVIYLPPTPWNRKTIVKEMTVSETPLREILMALVTNFLMDALSVMKYPLSGLRVTRSSK